MRVYLGIDTGGTFTDFVLLHANKLVTHKILSTPESPELAIVKGLHELGLFDLGPDDELFVVHGSTVATNAVLEGKGVKTVYVTNRGMGDILTIGRQARRELYNLQPLQVTPPVEKTCCLEIDCRLAADGTIIKALTEDSLAELKHQLAVLKPDAVAVNMLFSYINNEFEKTIAAMLPDDLFVSLSSRVLPEIKEYERGITTWLNAYVGPLVKNYILRLRAAIPHAQIHVMQSAGTTVHADQAGDEAVRMLLSGPAGGLAAAGYIKTVTRQTDLLTFDMGGTSTDVALVEHNLQLTNEAKIGNYPVAVPMVDMHTIGAGGGSIASVDAGGLLQVGPASAGANPGPACYGKGGELATVTDANLVLGRLLPNAFLGGNMTLAVEAANSAIANLAKQLDLSIEQTAAGVIQLANDHMTQALRVMTVQRGVDPRGLTLMSFGGAGGLHVCALADNLQMRRAIIPVHGGVLSALGMLAANKGRHLSHTLLRLLNQTTVSMIVNEAEALIDRGTKALLEEGVMAQAITAVTNLDCRYQGQSYTLTIPWQNLASTLASFHQLHETRYGHRLDLPVEVVNVRVAIMAKSTQLHLPLLTNYSIAEPWCWVKLVSVVQEVPVYARDKLGCQQVVEGPALITETVATSYIAPDWQAEVDAFGNLILTNSRLN